MKFWWVFSYDTYYPGGGMSDLCGRFSSKEEAQRYVRDEQHDGRGADSYEIINVIEESCRNE